MKEIDFTAIPKPVWRIDTPFGTLTLRLNGEDGVRLYTDRSEERKDDITINRVEYEVDNSLWLLPDGSLNSHKMIAGGGSVYAGGDRIRKKDQWDSYITDSARKKYDAEVMPLVYRFIADNPDIQRIGLLNQRAEFLSRRQSLVKELKEKLATAESEVALLNDQVSHLIEGADYPHSAVPRCSYCFSPMVKVNSRLGWNKDEKESTSYQWHCSSCRTNGQTYPIL